MIEAILSTVNSQQACEMSLLTSFMIKVEYESEQRAKEDKIKADCSEYDSNNASSQLQL